MTEQQREKYRGHLTSDERKFWMGVRIGVAGLVGCVYGAMLGDVQAEERGPEPQVAIYAPAEEQSEPVHLPTGKIGLIAGVAIGAVANERVK